MDDFERQALLEWRTRRSVRRRVLTLHALLWATVNLLLFVIWQSTSAQFPWFPLLGWLVGLVAHAAVVHALLSPDDRVLKAYADGA